MRLKGPLRRNHTKALSQVKKAWELTIQHLERMDSFQRKHKMRLLKLDRMILSLELEQNKSALIAVARQMERDAELIRRLNVHLHRNTAYPKKKDA